MHSASMTAYLATQGDLERLLLQWRQQHGPFFEFQVPGSPPVMVVADPEAIREVRQRGTAAAAMASIAFLLLKPFWC